MSSDVQPQGNCEDPQKAETSARAGRLIVVSAPSGAGKSSLVESVLGRIDSLRASVSYTTRPLRGTEKDGVDYHFVSQEQFGEMRDRGEFLEWARVHGHLYGTPVKAVREVLGRGEDMILDIDVNGADQIRRQMLDAITIFVLPPTREVLESRLSSRKLNTAIDIERRMGNAGDEVRNFERFDYIIVNDNLDRASAALEAIIIADRHRAARQKEIASRIIATFGGGLSNA